MIGALAKLAPALRGGRNLLAAYGGMKAVGVGYTFFKNVIPRLEDEVTVEITGQPGAKKKQLYYLALSTAFGLVKRFDAGVGGYFLSPPAGMLMIEYDAADNWVRATVKFNTGLAAAAATEGAGNLIGSISGSVIGGFIGSFVGPIGTLIGTLAGGLIGQEIGKQIQSYVQGTNENPNSFYAQAVVYSGPQDSVIGGAFNFTGVGPNTQLIPNTSRSPGAPRLPFEGFPILTTSPTIMANNSTLIPTPNPAPPGDNRSRGAQSESKSQSDPGLDGANGDNLNRKLIPLVFAALTNPGGMALEVFPPPQSGPGGV